MNIIDKYKAVILILIFVLAFIPRVYKLTEVPPAISWDEAAVGYNAWTIVKYGADEWGNSYPLTFKSFEDDKRPVHVYLTSFFIAIFGLSDLTIRLPSAVFGALGVLAIYLLAELVFNHKVISFSSAFLLATSPYGFQFSRFNHEAVICLFFFILGLVFFYQSVKKNRVRLLPWSVVSFGVSMLTYYAALVVTPFIMLLLAALYWREILNTKIWAGLSLLTLLLVMLLFVLTPNLLFSSRLQQVSVSESEIVSTSLYKSTGQSIFGRLEVTYNRYIKHLSPKFLFVNGDQNPKFSVQTVGQFFPINTLLLTVGVIYLIFQRTREAVILLVWAFLSPLPSSLTGGQDEVPHAARALFMMGSFALIAGAGVGGLTRIGVGWVRWSIALIVVAVIFTSFLKYLGDYFGVYRQEYSYAWQYGMREVTKYLQGSGSFYSQVFMTDIRAQPYIFFLYYLQTPLPEFLSSRFLNTTKYRSSNLVTFYDKYIFGEWNRVESYPSKGVLYILGSSEYDGLRYKPLFDIKKIVYYPNGTTAFYLVSARNE